MQGGQVSRDKQCFEKEKYSMVINYKIIPLMIHLFFKEIKKNKG
jgi:hypothetical protein